jgi:hypothetical protein
MSRVEQIIGLMGLNLLANSQQYITPNTIAGNMYG